MSHRYLKIRSTKKMDLPGQDTVEAKFLFEGPNIWEDQIDEDLLTELTEVTMKWQRTCEYSKEYLEFINPGYTRSSIIIATFVSPPSWYLNAWKDPVSYNKILLFGKLLELYQEADDFCEDNEGTDDHFVIVTFMGALWSKIIELRFNSSEELKIDPMFCKLSSVNTIIGSTLLLLLEIIMEAMDVFGMTRANTQQLALAFKSSYEGQCWLGLQDLQYRHDLQLQKFLRAETSGCFVIAEFWFLMAGLEIPLVIRNNFYWKRFMVLSGIPLQRMNDVYSIENEYIKQAKRNSPSDNRVLLYMKSEGLDCQSALDKVVMEHNAAVRELQDLYDFIKRTPSVVSELSDELQKVFYDSLHVMYSWPAFNHRGQSLMTRYGMTWTMTFEDE